jgi:signal transduction histidine kinase
MTRRYLDAAQMPEIRPRFHRARCSGEAEAARGAADALSVAHERIRVAEVLQTEVGERLAGISARAAAAQRALCRDAAEARTQIAAAAVTAREAIARARTVVTAERCLPGFTGPFRQRDESARAAAAGERLRLARDVHDLLGMGLSAVALKADLVGALIGRDNARAAAEIDQMSRICAAARADVRLVATTSARLSLVGELAAAGQILADAGIQVRATPPARPLPTAADAALALVLREAVTNILRHTAATTCTIEVSAGEQALRLRISNDGAIRTRSGGDPAGHGGGRGLANMTARVEAAGGRLTHRQTEGRFALTAQIPLCKLGPGAKSTELAVLGAGQAPL